MAEGHEDRAQLIYQREAWAMFGEDVADTETVLAKVAELVRAISWIGLEARCTKCGETFNPADEDDLEHGETIMGEPCGGAGELVGRWGTPAPESDPGVWVVVTHEATPTGGHVSHVEVLDAAPTWNLAALGQTCWHANVNGGDSVRVR